MATSREPARLPWMIPVPVRRSSFIPLVERHRELNVEVDLTQIEAFRYHRRPRPSSELLYADLQTNADENSSRRLGAGRSGVYRRHYLKGVGRTLLAGNWNCDGRGLYHGSGAMFTSAAIRELLTSAFIDAHGRSGAINPCIGVLLRRHPRQLAHGARYAYHRILRQTEIAAADEAMQAISVKPAGFHRFSNFCWWLSNYPQIYRRGASPAAELFATLSASLGRQPHDPRSDDAAAIVERLLGATQALVQNLLATWALGICWGSYHNNFTTDGRFLDLEVPQIFARAFVGSLTNAAGSGRLTRVSLDRCGPLVGFDQVTTCLVQVKIFLSFVRFRLEHIIAHSLCDPREIAFMKEFVDRLRRELARPNLLSSVSILEELVVRSMAKTLGAGEPEQRVLRAMLHESCWRRKLYPGLRRPRPSRASMLYRMKSKVPLARPEPDVVCDLYAPGFLVEQHAPVEANVIVNNAIMTAEQMTDPDALLGFLSTVPQSLRAAARAS